MKFIRTLTFLAALSAAVPAWAHSTSAQAPATPSAWTQNMDKQRQSMRELHDQMLAARTPEERSRLMAEQTKLMQGGMDMMGGMGPGAGMGMGMGMGGPGMQPGAAAERQGAMPMGARDAGTRMQMMEMRMEMMQSMMQMMIDRTAPAPASK